MRARRRVNLAGSSRWVTIKRKIYLDRGLILMHMALEPAIYTSDVPPEMAGSGTYEDDETPGTPVGI